MESGSPTLICNSSWRTASIRYSHMFRSSHQVVYLGEGVLKICSKFTGEHTYRSVILMKLQNKFIEIALRYECSPVNLVHIFRTPFSKNTPGRLLLHVALKNYFIILSIVSLHSSWVCEVVKQAWIEILILDLNPLVFKGHHSIYNFWYCFYLDFWIVHMSKVIYICLVIWLQWYSF